MQRNFNVDNVNELLIQALETERGGIKIYTAVIQVAANCARHDAAVANEQKVNLSGSFHAPF